MKADLAHCAFIHPVIRFMHPAMSPSRKKGQVSMRFSGMAFIVKVTMRHKPLWHCLVARCPNLSTRLLTIRTNHVAGFFRDHDGGGVGVAGGDGGHDGSVDYAQAREAVNA